MGITVKDYQSERDLKIQNKTIQNKKTDNLIIPAVMLKKSGDNYEEIFLDGLTLNDIRKTNKNMKVHILYNYYGFDEILNIINSLWWG